MQVLSESQIQCELERLASGYYCANVGQIALAALDHFSAPEEISTLEYSITRRKVRAGDGRTSSNWSAALTPYAPPVMAALDNPKYRAVIVPKPARSGGTMVVENYLLKLIEFGPFAGCLWYLAGPNEVASYAKRVFGPMFEDHPGVVAKLTARPGSEGNTKTLKNFDGANVELAAIGPKTTTNRQEALIVFDEPDSYPPDFRSSWLNTGKQRGKMLGNLLKIFACSHPDLGWRGGISQGWLSSTMGILVMPCAECGEWASPYPTKHWPDVPRFTLDYQKLPERSMVGDRIRVAGETASLLCPHCGSALTEAQRLAMCDQVRDMHKGQILGANGPEGEPLDNENFGLWWHAYAVKQTSLAELAKELEEAIEHFERTGKSEKIRSVMIRTFGEAFESVSETTGLDAVALRKRATEMAEAERGPRGYRMGEVPPGVKFITASVDPGGKKFDVMLTGWDLQRRRWMLDRFTIRQRKHRDGVMRDIATTKVQEDWSVLVDQVIDRVLPFRDDPANGLPVAVTVIDSGDGNATAFAYEFARRMDRKRWGQWRKVRCIKGAKLATAPQLSPTPSTISKDDDGNRIEPTVTLHMVGGHSLKSDVLETLAISDGSAGQWFFPDDYPESAFEEFFNEPLIEGKFVRNGPNESLDLGGYGEAARQMLEPDRVSLKWDQSAMPPGKKWTPDELPIWASPISLASEGGDLADENDRPAAKPAKPKTILDKFQTMNGASQ